MESLDVTLDLQPEAPGPRVIQGFRLSAQQVHLWRLAREEAGAFRVRGLLRITGKVDEEALWSALLEVVERHEILRTSFELLPALDAPLQVIGPARLAARETRDLRAPAPEAWEAVLAELLAAPARPATEGGLAATLVRLAPEDRALGLDLSPLAGDSPTLSLLTAELARAYAGRLEGREPAEPGTQYADFAEWQRELLEGEEVCEEAAAWRGPGVLALAGPPLPWAAAGAPGPYAPAETPVQVSDSVAAAASREGEVFWLAVWAAALARLSGERRIAVAVVLDGRDYEDLSGALGLLARAVPVVCEAAPETRWFRFLAAVRGAAEDARARQDSFLWEQVNEDPARAPFPAYAFRTEDEPLPVAAGGATFRLAARSACSERSLAELLCRRHGGRLVPVLRYDSSRLAAGDAARLAACLGTLAESAAACPQVELGDLDLLPAAERARLLVELNRTVDELPGAGLLHGPFLRQAVRTPERVALRAEGVALTYGELAGRAAALARRLNALGVGPDVPVAVCLERSPEMVTGLLGVLLAGGAYVPLDPEHPLERRTAILAEVRPPVVLTRSSLAATLPAELPRLCLDELLPAAPEAGAAAEPAPGHLAYILYTSGSTGRPKGVMVPHQAISNRLLWMQRDHPLSGEDRVLQKTPYGFDASIWEIFCPLYAGAELVLARPGGHQDMAYLAAVTAAAGITTLQLVPSLLRAFLDEPGAAACTGLRRIFCGGEALPTDLAGRCVALLGASLHNLYGPTETAIDATSWPCREGTGERTVPIGRPIANLRVYVADARMHPVPAGVPGELLIGGSGGAGLARGYLGRPDTTAERFLPDPFGGEPGGRLYRTGDLARHRAGGELEYLGRLDRQLKVRGVRIEPREIEIRLREHPAVREAVVASREDAGGARLIAWIVGKAGGAVDVWELRGFLRERLPEAMIPAAFVPIPAVPLTSNGKLDLAVLPEPAAAAARPGAVAPRSETEALLTALWAEVLGVETVGVHDNFFDLGGHSLSATQLVSRIRKSLRVELAVHHLFDAPTVAGLARELDAAVRGGAAGALPPIERVPRSGALPLSFAQQRLWFYERRRPGTAVFNIVVTFRLLGSLRIDLLARAFTEVVRRHEVLRTTFPDRSGLPVQEVGEPWAVPLPVVDLAALAPAAREAETARLVLAEGERPFDLAAGPLLRLLVLRHGPEEHVLPFLVHHIVSDAWSSGILTRELAALYRAFAAGEPSPLPELPIQYADFAAWQQRQLAEGALAPQIAYWKKRLAAAPPLLDLPADRPRPEAPSYRGLTWPVALPAALSEKLRDLGLRQGATPFMILLAALQVLLRHQTGRDDLVVGTDVAGRNRVEIEGLLGFFVNQLALRTDLSGDPTFAELLARARETTLGAYAHQDAPFENVVDALKLPRTLAHAPVFQVKLFVDNSPPGDFRLPGLTFAPLELETEVAKLDLTLAFWQRGGVFEGWINYNTDLFDSPRIERMLGHYRALLEAVAERPDARLSELDRVLSEITRKEHDMEKKDLREMSFKKFKAVAPRAVVLAQEEVVERTFLAPGQELPLVLQPLVPDVDIADWAAAHREEIETDLLRYGAVLFRGFGIDTPEAMERFASTLCPDLFNENGEHPRESVSGNVYTPVFYPQDQQLLWHNENSFNWGWPRKIFFACARPADAGGETPIVDSRRVYREIPAEIRERFEKLGVTYQRNYSEALGLHWKTVFQVDEKEAVEKECREDRFDFEWRDGDRLRTRALRPGVVRHPVTGERTWFNQAQHWHVSCLDPETSKAMRTLFPDEGDLPRHCSYGDGSPIADAEMDAIRDVYRRLEVSFPWQRGDVLMLDNVLTAHGRNPYKGQRKILVALGQMTTYSDLQEA